MFQNFDFGELFLLASTGMIILTPFLVFYMVILAFAGDKIVRPRLFSCGAICFAASITIPVFGMMMVIGLGNAFSLGGGRRASYSPYGGGGGSMGDVLEIVFLIVSLGVTIVAPLLLSISILLGFIGLVP